MTDNEHSPAAAGESTAHTTMVFRQPPDDAATPSGLPRHPAPAGEVMFGSGTLLIVRGPGNPTRYLLDRETMGAGRHPDSDIVLDDISVSRYHAHVRWHNGEYWIADVGSLNGTYVNGVQVESLPLADGDQIKIGVFRLSFACLRTPVS
ncbi:FHA domain-containing protein [Mycolicibacterium llatzerense]|uniref:FHA domain-containing protein n=1 Tax=Mycolicibacterium llatzerense TaxID=280871 RepID=UPI0008DDB319|nr:FHA domain-containing protein [Mycolicibacterium llatzerense]